MYFIGLEYYNNFTQTNTTTTHLDTDKVSRVDYKLDETKIYVEQTNNATTTSYYLQSENGNFYYYQNNNGNWTKYSIDEETFNRNNANGVSADTRALLYDGSNYQKSNDKYIYVGDTVYFELGNERIEYDTAEITIEDGILTISFTIYGGIITGEYKFSNVNTTVVDLPIA